MQEATGVRYSDKVSTSPAFALVVEGYNYLVQENLIDQYGKGVQWHDRVLYVQQDGEILSCLVFQHSPAQAAFVVRVAYTEPSSRKKGHFKALWNELLNLADKNDPPVDRIRFQVDVGDHAMQSILEGPLDMDKSFIQYDLELGHAE